MRVGGGDRRGRSRAHSRSNSGGGYSNRGSGRSWDGGSGGRGVRGRTIGCSRGSRRK